ncbi:hypothetical protein DKE48_017455 [Acinetobacter nosocomialis]|uniref:hypothetical protein n=1 Tax=Acinetobacter baumannii TaxID=470 RepID=UPI000449A310|nr:hypothetical protein [Acinetobacter baumannii]AZC08514.1 hypothetical protein DKE48_017455 [Acinetobacter nosocomialis]EXH10590.1 hypothetical protein J627_3202 [Acinetobacter sp. 1245593]EXR26469.1 hypothetical protein J694_3240 [Acinetobacter sp. 1281984]PNN09249.1 hypothetical protein AL489_004255 [Acinetobacter sp. FDAARGOS_131]MDH2572698.1 hypothetical protein [Acinetobacter baumannii]
MSTNNSLQTKTTQCITCDICDQPTSSNYGVLKSDWDPNTDDKKDKYEVRLCKSCFLGTLSYLRNQKKLNHLFDENFDFNQLDNLGLS